MRFYEKHIHDNPEFPFYFQEHRYASGITCFEAHWHESIELLYLVRGGMLLHIDGETVQVRQGQCFVVNSDRLHSGQALQDGCEYYCLIVDLSASDWIGINVRETAFVSPVEEDWQADEFEFFRTEFTQAQDAYARIALKLRILSMITRLAREHAQPEPRQRIGAQKRTLLGRRMIEYLDAHFHEELTTQGVCAALGFSESYACHVFRDATGMTVTEYLQYRRCRYAQRLLKSGQYNVSEAANESGFTNLSYFTRTYRRHLGKLPSADLKKSR